MLRRLFHDLRTEGAGATRETAAVALGVFIGCLPIYGLHLLICWIAGFLLGLNRVKMYLAASISTGTYSLVRTSAADRPFADLVRRAADRYLGASITAWEFARGKLRMDPI